MKNPITGSESDEEWDEETVYDEKLFPLMEQIIAVCTEHNIPMLASFALSSKGMVCTSHLLEPARTPEKYVRMLGVLAGKP